MEENVIAPKQNTRDSLPSSTKAVPKGKPEVGRIGLEIGTGENAKNSIVWRTITWSFIFAGGASIALYLRSFCLGIDQSHPLVEEIKMIWSIFIPIITLALGYIFGKGR